MQTFLTRMKDTWMVLTQGTSSIASSTPKNTKPNLVLIKGDNVVPISKPKPKKQYQFRYFLAGPEGCVLWVGKLTADGERMTMYEYCMNPFTDKMDWCGSYFDEWDMDKSFGVTEITRQQAEERHPDCVEALMKKYSFNFI